MAPSPFSISMVILVLCLTGVEGRGRQHGKTTVKSHERRQTLCDPRDPFRTADGQCNNVKHTDWGSTAVAFRRLVASVYDDGAQSPRTKAKSGSPLPSAREVSVKCHTPKDTRSDVTMMVMQWGQFLDHDITLTPHSMETEEPVSCDCGTASSECFNIPITNDEFFTSRACFEFIRSGAINAADDFKKGPIRQQTNAITAFVDASNVYGSSKEEQDALRDVRGRLKETDAGSRVFLPEGSADSCNAKPGEFCFLAGDERVNEQPGLATMHTLFMLEHNRIADYFRHNTNWNSDRIFQETRKIVGAIMQRITYNEFLPAVLGNDLMSKYELDLKKVYRYDPGVRPDISNAFATAAFRFGHSLIPDEYNLSSGPLPFPSLFFSPTAVLTKIKELAAALVTDNAMTADGHFTHSVTRHLFQTNDGDGFDLVALNIQRGRDHGLPSYNEYRKFCGDTSSKSLNDLFPEDKSAASVYSSIEDVDLFTGGMTEPVVKGGLVGKTFGCILARQFQSLKFGDRFFYQNEDDRDVRFNKEQRVELERVTLARIICNNELKAKVQPEVFKPVDASSNPETDCFKLKPSPMDLTAWTKERKSRRSHS